MKTIQLLLGVMVVSAMVSAYADDQNDPNNPHPRGQQRSDQQSRPAVQAGAGVASHSSFAPPLPLPTQPQHQQIIQQATQQPQIGNRPVGGGGNYQQRPNNSFSQGGLDTASRGDNRPDNRGNGAGPRHWTGGNVGAGSSGGSVTTTSQPVESFQGGNPNNDQQGRRWNNDDRRGADNRGTVITPGGLGAAPQGSGRPANVARWRWQQQQQDTHAGWNPAVTQNNDIGRTHGYNGGIGWSQDSQGHSIRSVPDRSWQNHYRMPLADGGNSRYSVRYHRGWHPDYDWRDHGWRTDYQSVDPYWFAVVTSMAFAQSWSDDELSQAINDDNLRQQLLYDASVRQQMVSSGFPEDQVDYPPEVVAGDPGYDPNYDQGYYQGTNLRADPGVGYDPNRDPTFDPSYDPRNDPNYVSTSAPVYTTERIYRAPPVPYSLNPNSPNNPYEPSPARPADPVSVSVTPGDQVANRNANKNVQFFCNAKNRAETQRAFRQVQSLDLSVWPDIESFNTCRIWSGAR